MRLRLFIGEYRRNHKPSGDAWLEARRCTLATDQKMALRGFLIHLSEGDLYQVKLLSIHDMTPAQPAMITTIQTLIRARFQFVDSRLELSSREQLKLALTILHEKPQK